MTVNFQDFDFFTSGLHLGHVNIVKWRHIDVGWDAWKRPVSREELLQLINP